MSSWKNEYMYPKMFPRRPIEMKIKDALGGPAKFICADVEESTSFDGGVDLGSDSDSNSDSDCASAHEHSRRVSKKLGNNFTSTVTMAGAFHKEMFTAYVGDICSTDCLHLSPERIAALRSACMISRHADERKNERYSKRTQEFLRSLTTTTDCLAVKNRRYFLFIGPKIIEISSSYRVIHVTENKSSAASRHYRQTKALPLSAVRKLKESACRWNERFYLPLRGRRRKKSNSSYLPLSEDEIASIWRAAKRPLAHDTLKVFSTTTTFIVSANFKKIITCYPTYPSYSCWLKRTKSKPKRWGGRKQDEAADTMATTKKASKSKPPFVKSRPKRHRKPRKYLRYVPVRLPPKTPKIVVH